MSASMVSCVCRRALSQCTVYSRRFNSFSQLMCSNEDGENNPENNQGKTIKIHLGGKRSVERRQKHLQEKKEREEYPGVDPILIKAAQDVAKRFGNEAKTTETDLLKQLRSNVVTANSMKNTLGMLANMTIKQKKVTNKMPSNDAETNSLKEPAHKSSGMLANMPLKKPQQKDSVSLAEKQYNTGDRHNRKIMQEQYTLFQGERLGIFHEEEKATSEAKSETFWDQLVKEELEASTTYPPVNAWDEQIQWTQQGKLWHFPIDNDQGLDHEANVGFHEHVFLEPLIQDFPEKGPIRHFMDLVLVGLSSNPYLTVDMKREHIQWFREYFKSKIHLLQETVGQEQLGQLAD